MIKAKLILSAIATLILSTTVNASLISIDSRSVVNTIDNTDFATSWTDQASTITHTDLDIFNRYRSGSHTINLLTIDFNMASTGSWGFDLGLDAGYGAAFYLDNNLVSNRTDDLWWSYNWNHSDVMHVLDNTLASGNHTIEIYWAEKCCNGASSAKFTADGSNWLALSTENIDAASSVPEPGSIALLCIGLVGFSLSRIKKSN